MSCRAHRLFFVTAALWSIACRDPCGAPLTYRVGTVDERFRVTRGEVLTALHDAQSIWDDGTKRNLFAYDRDGTVPVNFVYDDRQKTAQDNAKRERAIDSQGSAADQLRREVDKAKNRLETAKREYRDAAASFEAALAQHNRAVQQWNARGGAPEDAQQSLEREAAALRSVGSKLDEQRHDLDALIERINSLTDRYNAVADEINSDIDAVNSTAGREFKQGRFVRDADGPRIEIYEYVDHGDLVHVLAHELGHALGLEHNENPQSIMYGQSATETARLTAEDIDALRVRCGR
jgi:hypothetical protein